MSEALMRKAACFLDTVAHTVHLQETLSVQVQSEACEDRGAVVPMAPCRARITQGRMVWGRLQCRERMERQRERVLGQVVVWLTRVLHNGEEGYQRG